MNRPYYGGHPMARNRLEPATDALRLFRIAPALEPRCRPAPDKREIAFQPRSRARIANRGQNANGVPGVRHDSLRPFCSHPNLLALQRICALRISIGHARALSTATQLRTLIVSGPADYLLSASSGPTGVADFSAKPDFRLFQHYQPQTEVLWRLNSRR